MTHAQGAGKTVTAITDALRIGGRTLFVAHTHELVQQAAEPIPQALARGDHGAVLRRRQGHRADNLVGTVDSLTLHLNRFKPDDFAYLIIDEAHHATAESYQKLLRYFRPRFTLGLTATPDRADGLSALEVFRNTAHRLTLREAVERGELVPIRCVRVRTNVDLTRVRFNQVQYNRRDIEETVLVPSRDRLIVETYRDHVPGRKAVAFCVNVRHGEELAERFRSEGIPARGVSGRMSRSDRAACLEAFARGEIRVLCACDLLNEGWDCPDVEVLLMARPTLSKVIYLQQLGRGTRKAAGQGVPRRLRLRGQRDPLQPVAQPAPHPGQPAVPARRLRAGPARPDQPRAGDPRRREAADAGPADRPLGAGLRGDQRLQLAGCHRGHALGVGPGSRAGRGRGPDPAAIARGLITPDHTLTLGERTYHYFLRDRAEEIREALGLPRVDDASIRELFLDFAERMEMSSSYKPVMLLAILDHVDDRGRRPDRRRGLDIPRVLPRPAAGRA